MFLFLFLLRWCVSSHQKFPTWTEGFLPSKSANQMRTSQSAIFVICLSRGDRNPSEFHWQCKQFSRNFGNVYFASERAGAAGNVRIQTAYAIQTKYLTARIRAGVQPTSQKMWLPLSDSRFPKILDRKPEKTHNITASEISIISEILRRRL
jgi:hypothetical protein